MLFICSQNLGKLRNGGPQQGGGQQGNRTEFTLLGLGGRRTKRWPGLSGSERSYLGLILSFLPLPMMTYSHAQGYHKPEMCI